MDELTGIVERDAQDAAAFESPHGAYPEMDVPQLLADRRYLLGLLRDVRSSVVFMVGVAHGRYNHRADPNECPDPLCQSERLISARLAALGESHE